MNYSFTKKNQLSILKIFTILILSIAAQLSIAQCPMPCTDHQATFMTSDLPVCSGAATFDAGGDVDNNSDCDDGSQNCFEFIIINDMMSVNNILTRIGKGSGCNGEVDYFYTDIDGVCTQIPSSGSQNMISIPFGMNNMISVFICDNSSGQVSMCGLCADVPCSFAATCNLSPDVQFIQGCTMADVPVPYTDYTDVFTNTSFCGTPVFSVIDSGTGELCTAVPLQKTRMYKLGDDLDGNGIIEGNEPFELCTEIYVIQNNIPPSITCPADQLGAECFGNIVPGVPIISGECSTPDLDVSDLILTDGVDGCSGAMYDRVFTVTDECDLTATCTQKISIINDGPTITCPADANVDCYEDIAPGAPIISVSCGYEYELVISEIFPTETFGGPCDGNSFLIQYTVTDQCDRSAMCTQYFTVTDTGPSITCPADATVGCYGDITIGVPTVTSNCSPAVVTNSGIIPEDINAGECDSGEFSITFTATDECGRTASCTQSFIVIDEGPSITCPADMTVDCYGDITIGVPTVTSNCSSANVTNSGILSNGTVDEPCTQSNFFIIYTATDECGRTASCTQNFHVNDDGPTITCPADENLDCYSDITIGVPTVSNNCSPVTVTNSGILSNGTVDEPCTQSVFFITYTATDECGRSASCTQYFEVSDQGPSITCPADMTLECYGDIMVGTPTTTSDCSGITVTNSGIIPDDIYSISDCDGDIYTIVYTATDECQRTASCTQTFTIQNAGPTITCPADMTVECIFFDNINLPPTYETSCDYDATLIPGEVVISGELNCPGYSITYPYTVEDECGRTASCSFTCTIDNEAPTITCPPNTTVECVDDVTIGEPTAILSCDEIPVIVVDDNIIGTPGCNGAIYEYTFGVTDACDRSANCTQTITIENEAPTITCPANYNAECFADVVAGTATATLACNQIPNIIIDGPTLISGTAACDGAIYEFTYTVTDACGRTAECLQQITIQNDAPTITCPADVTISCPEEVVNVHPEYTVSCESEAIVTVVAPVISAEIFCTGGEIIYTFTVEDECFRTASCEFKYIVEPVAPVLPVPPVDLMLQCATDVPTPVDLTAIFECSEDVTVSPVAEVTPGDCPNNFTMVRTWTFMNECGTYEVSQTINVNDDTAPVAPTPPADVNVQCATDIPPPVDLTAMDNCDGEITDSPVAEVTPGDCPNNFTMVRTWTFEDACGNISSTSQTINVNDDTAPVPPVPPADVEVQCAADIPAPVDLTALDNCNGEITVSPTPDITPGDCPNNFTMIRTWTFTDECGNTSEVSQTINVNDDTAPVITVGATSITVECGPDNQNQFDAWLAQNVATISGTDNCGGVELVYDPIPNFSEICGSAGYNSIQFNLVDECGNTSIPTIGSFTIEDTTAPFWTSIPEDTSIDCCDQPNFGTPIADDLCNEVILTFSDETNMDGDCPNEFSITRTWIAYDDCGNASVPASQTIFVQDNTPPVMVPNHPLLVDLESGDTLVLDCTNTEVFTAQDFFIGDCCDPNASIMMMDDVLINGGCNEDGVRIRMYCIWIGKDACGNTTEFDIYIDYIDTTAPTFTSFPDDVTIDCADVGGEFEAPTGEDDCDEYVLITFTVTPSSDCSNGGIHWIRTYTIEDECGNSYSRDQNFTLIDNNGPTFSNLPATSTISCDETPEFLEAFVVDDCGEIASLTNTTETFDNGCEGSVVRTWTAVDDCGNTSTATETINFTDEENPVFTNVPADLNISCNETTIFGEPTVGDNCDTDLEVSHSDNTTVDGCTVTQTRTWTATDNCGNSATAAQSIISTDDEAPVISSIPATIEIECGGGTVWDTPTAIDNCDDNVILTSSDETLAEGCATGFAIQRTWTATDACGNFATTTQTAHFVDTQNPYFTFVPEDINAGCSDVNFGTATATDACDDNLELTEEDTSTSNGCATIHTRTWTVTDNCGNSASASQSITTNNDNEIPVITNVGNDLYLACGETADFSQPSVSDDCAETSLSSADETTSSGCSTTTTRTWTATDACGNTATASQSITTTNDNEAPILGDIASDFVGECNQEPNWETPTVSDNCGEVTLTFEDSNNGGSCESGYDITRTWTATDDCGNTSTISQTVWIYSTNNESTIAFSFIPLNRTMGCNEQMNFGTPIGSSTCENYNLTYEDVMNETDCSDYSVTRKWTATDDCEGVATCEQTISVVDNVAPYFTYVPDDMAITCEQEVTFGTPTCEDECSHISNVTWEDDVVQNCGSSYSITRTWTIKDACGNSNTTSQRVDVNDTNAPLFANTLQNKSVNCGDTFEFDTPTASESCGGNFELTFEDETSNDNCSVNYTITRTWSATDECGNIANISQTITRPADNVAPIFNNVPSDKMITCGQAPQFDTPLFSDNCSEVTITNTDATATQDCQVNTTRTWTISDACGNTATAAQTITSMDNAAPVFTSTPADLVIDCNTTPTFGTPIVEDNCGQVELTFNDEVSTGDCATGYTLTRTWSAIDPCGNVVTTAQMIIVTQEIAVSFNNVPANKIIACNEELSFGTPEVTTNCDESVELDFTDTMIEGTCATSYSMIRTWTAIACGVEISATSTITIEDDQLPTFDLIPENKTITCGELPQFDIPQFSDNCSEVNMTHTDATSSASCEISTTRTWTISDACGNTATAAQTITSMDNAAPVFTSTPADLVIDCNTTPTFGTPIVEDNCGQVELTFNDEVSTGDCTTGYTLTRTWSAIDPCGNVVTTAQMITITQEIAITFNNVPANKIIACNEELSFGTPEVATNCDESVELDFTDTMIEGTCATSYSMIRTWTAIACGVEISATSTITIEDDQLPTFDLIPENKTITCGELPQFEIPQFSDNCSEVNITHTDATSNASCEISTTRTWTISDACGNLATASQTITLVDETAPVIEPFTIISSFNCGAEVSIDTPSALDDCNNVSLNFSDETTQGDCDGSYSIARTWTATDVCGNMSTTVQQIEVSDNEAPVLLSSPADFEITCSENPTFGEPTFADDCGQIELNYQDENSTGDCTTGYDITRTWFIADGCGNIITTSQTITIIPDVEAILSFVSIPVNQTIQCGVNLEFDTPAANSTCGEISITFEDEMLEGNCGNDYSMTRTWSIEDSCENEITTSQTIYVTDEEAPELTLFTTVTQLTCDAEIPMDTPTAFDNCGNVTVTHQDQVTDGLCAGNYNITRTWTATDDCGNTSSTIQQIEVSDNSAPILLFAPADYSMGCDEEPAFGVPTYQDNCGNVEMTSDDDYSAGDCTTGYDITRTWTIVDACGNEITTQQTITVNANASTSIVFDTNLADRTVNCGSEVIFDTPLATADPTCGEVNITFEDDMISGSCANTYAVTRTWTALDECENLAVMTQTIFVEDTTAPVFSSTPVNKLLNCVDQLVFDEMEALDDCGTIAVEFNDEVINDVNCPNAFVQIRTWTATDICGNTNTVSQTITVEDNTIPTFTFIPTNKVISCNENVTFDEVEAIDDCGDITVTFADSNESSDLCSGLNKFTRIWTVSDGCGNINSVFQSITIEDNVAPEFMDAMDAKYLVCGTTLDLELPSVLDDCSNVTLQYQDEPMEEDDDCMNDLSFRRIWMAVDECGNSSTKEQYVYIEDTEAPVFDIMEEIFLTEQEFRNWSIPEITVNDNCSAVTISGPAEEIETGCREIKYTYTWFASDHCGNRSEMTSAVHVEKNAGDDCLLISPNPISFEELKVIFEANVSGNSTVKVYDLLGREVYNVAHEVTEGQNKIFLNLDHLSASTYVITVEADNRLYSRKFIKILK